MYDIPSVLRLLFAGLILFQITVLAARFFSCESRGELVRFAVFLIFLGLRIVMTPASPAFPGISVCVIWAAGTHLSGAGRSALRRAWTPAGAVFLFVLVFASLLGYGRSAPFTAFFAFFSGLFLCYPIALLASIVRETRRALHVFLLISVGLTLAAGAGEAALSFMGLPFADLASWAISLLTLCTAWLVFQEGYLLRTGRRGFPGVEPLKAAYARILATENALVIQDRLIVTGLLAMGAAHEFKNVLAHVRATAESALENPSQDHKDACLRLLAEHADAGGRAAVDFLVRFSREGREEAKPLDAAELLAGFAKTARAGLRSAGIILKTEAQNGIRLMGRRREIEQILMNLSGNAADCFKRGGGREPRIIELACRSLAEAAVIEIRDNAGGVPPACIEKLFQISSSDSGSTGLGLYLSRSLAERNGGSLAYVPVDDGSCFRLTLPVANPPTSDTRSV